MTAPSRDESARVETILANQRVADLEAEAMHAAREATAQPTGDGSRLQETLRSSKPENLQASKPCEPAKPAKPENPAKPVNPALPATTTTPAPPATSAEGKHDAGLKDVWNFGRKIKFGDLGEATRDQQIAAFQSWLKSDAQRAVCDLSFADALGKFIEAIEQADVPPGLSGLAERAGAASIGGPIPRCWREVAQFIHDPVCRLLQVAWWMSQQVGPDQPFPLTQSNVAAWLGSDTWRASRVVTAMQAAGVLKCTNRGRQRGKGKKGLAALYLFVKFSQDTDPEPEGGFHG